MRLLLNFFKFYYPSLSNSIEHKTIWEVTDSFASCFWKKIWETGIYTRYYRSQITEEEKNVIMQGAYDYINDSFKNKSVTYNESFVGKILNGLDFFGIEYSTINVEEMERCLSVLKQRYESLDRDGDIKNYRTNCLYELESWNETYNKECLTDEGLNDIFYKIRILYVKTSYIFTDFLKNGDNNYSLKDLKKVIEDLKLEITNVENIVKIKKSEWMLNDGFDNIRFEFLPHNYARAFLEEFVLPNIKNEEKILKKIDDNIYDEIYKNVGKKLMDLGYDYYECCLNIYIFCNFIIKKLTEFIELLKENEKYLEAKELIYLYHDDVEINNEYFSLFNYLIKIINDELIEKNKFKSNVLAKKQ